MSFGPHITRRDFLNGVLLSLGGMLLGCRTSPRVSLDNGSLASWSVPPDWYGYGGVGDYRFSHGNTPEAVETAHRLRDGGFPADFTQVEVIEEYDLVIVGAGIAGLGAALEYSKKRKPGQSCLMLDNHPIFGGEAKENEFDVGGVRLFGPQGSNGFFVPEAVSDPDGASGDPRYYAELGVPREFRYRDWPSEEKPLGFSPDNYEYMVRGLEGYTSVGHFFGSGVSGEGQWAVDMWERQLANTPLSEATRETLLRWHASGATRRFGSDEEAARALDTMSYEEFLGSELRLGAEAARYADLFLASACGLGSDAVSAYAAYRLPMPGLTEPVPPDLRRVSFPGGNSGFVRYFVKRLIPDAIAGSDSFEEIITGRIDFGALDRRRQPLRLRLRSTVIGVEHEGHPASSGSVKVVYARDGRLRAVRARAVIMATGGWMNRYVVRDLPPAHREAYMQFIHAPFLVANVALTNWRFLYRLGITAAIWDREEGDFGYTCNLRKPMLVGDYRPPLDPDQPTVLSFYTPFHRPGLPLRTQATLGRTELLRTSYPEYEGQIYGQMMKLFAASGFDPGRDVAGLILNRWGHAYSVPFPGFFGGASGRAPRDVIRTRHGRIAFAHSELDGLQHWGPAADEGRRAFNQLADAI
ncbi:MAG: NAD(P)-binding protein [Gemmatimonadetes bacterium]|uniref:NAD(P)-binding protein n=1 Tax=Candidatus Kutchimonas denitrificans TaxID=3056748 RepID=A0AAE4ZD86_9BACT|nr:NAD(P)-binding protein [Gemmatimonadota bacterium]NIR76060.1 NAD(P)-binding protein [Candidatus Kutchimonas denitrificans]NIS00439.1 NAD(P)-binding protein [Gemmatimonadota bacterium]NIT66097.1 NAD(P)-binding protein [Gemmatimonadota bacterium]NIU54175.1 NAD(P)-binding protein [Gemmatimonadota bacterium]